MLLKLMQSQESQVYNNNDIKGNIIPYIMELM
jgi:hypothetical protein